MSALLKDIESGILSELLGLRYDQVNGYVRVLDSFGGDIDSIAKERVTVFPCCLVKYVRTKYRQCGGGMYEVTTEWSIIVGDNTYTSEKQRREGNGVNAHNPGVYKLLEDVRELLEKKTVFAGTKPAILANEEIVRSDTELCLAQQEWKIGFNQK